MIMAEQIQKRFASEQILLEAKILDTEKFNYIMTTDKNKNDDEKNLPRDINPKEVNFEPSAKEWKSEEKTDAKYSGKGRDAIDDPADEQFAKKDAQIDHATIKLQEDLKKKKTENSDE